MSAFCVFAASLLVARERAGKRLPTKDPKTGVTLSEVEWRERVEEIAKASMTTMRPVQVSPAYDAPQFCEHWIDEARKTNLYDGFVVKCRGKKKDKRGNVRISKTKGTPLVAWIPYEPVKTKVL